MGQLSLWMHDHFRIIYRFDCDTEALIFLGFYVIFKAM